MLWVMPSSIGYICLSELSHATGLPASWLKREADAGRLPSLRAGRRRMFDIVAVRAALAEMAARSLANPEAKEADRAS